MTIPLEARLSRYTVRANSGCLIWTGAKKKGYAICGWREGGRSITVRVSRLVLENELKRPIKTGYYALHKCNNPSCVEAEHIYEGTQSRNMIDRANSGNDPKAQKTHCPQGHEYSGDNLIWYDARRYCRTCRDIRVKEFKQKRRRLKLSQ
jgi:hypothetical protein